MAFPSITEATSRRSLNFNSFLQFIAICALVWVGATVSSTRDRLAKIDEQLAVMTTANASKWEQLDRIESEVSKQRDQLRDLQIDVSKLKNNVK